MKLPKETVKIKLGDFEGWLLSDDGVGRAFAPLEHCDEEGNVVKLEIGYAHYYQDNIMRFGEKIGTSKDIKLA